MIAGKVTPVPVSLPKGEISINARPLAEVFVDGSRVGDTPVSQLSLPVGIHEIVFRHPELGERRGLRRRQDRRHRPRVHRLHQVGHRAWRSAGGPWPLAMPTGAGAAVQVLRPRRAICTPPPTTAKRWPTPTRLRPAATAPEDVRAIEQYRASLFALGQAAEAELVVESIAAIDPTWTLPAGEARPRLATLFAQARERALPGVLARAPRGGAGAVFGEALRRAAEAFTGAAPLEDPAMAKAGPTSSR